MRLRWMVRGLDGVSAYVCRGYRVVLCHYCGVQVFDGLGKVCDILHRIYFRVLAYVGCSHRASLDLQAILDVKVDQQQCMYT